MGNKQIRELNQTVQEQETEIERLTHENCILKHKFNSVNKIGQECKFNKENIIKQLVEHKANRDYKYLVFSGGAVKGVAYAGALELLEHMGILNNIIGYAGNSVGSIAASLLAIGYEYTEIIEFLRTIDYEKILDDKWGYIRDGINIIKDYGLAPGNYLYELMGNMIEQKTGNKDYTIDDLYRDKGIKLVLVGVDLNRMKVLYFYPEHHDENMRNVPIRLGIKISVCIPWVFEPVEFNGSLCVDGGVLDCYPIHAFDGEYPGDPLARRNLCPPNPEVLGMDLNSSNTVSDLFECDKNKLEIKNIIEYSMSYIDLWLTETERRYITPFYWYRTINIITPTIPSSKFDLSEEERRELINIGKNSALKFFENDDIDSECPET